jgi:F420-dependent oxidoreductase-like protein
MTLRLGIGANPYTPEGVAFVRDAERLGVDSVWMPEAWGFDALTPLAFLAARTSTIRLGTAIAQLGARTPAMLAMSALSMQVLSGGRFVLGLGTSGPQVMEGWHGVRFEHPVTRTRETIEIIRQITRGERSGYEGEVYTLPLPGGSGRSIRSSAPSASVPIYVASLGPANLRLTGALADGWLGTSFMPETAGAFLDPIREGAAAAGRTVESLDLTVPAAVEFTDDVDEAAKRHARGYAFTFGAMGSERQNFYNHAFARQGFGDDVAAVEQLWRSGDREAAAERVPTEIGLRTNLLGTSAMVAERLRRYRDAGITTLRVHFAGSASERLDHLGTLLDLVAEVNAQGAVR